MARPGTSQRPAPREVTPAERRATLRTFALILLMFVAGLSVLAAVLTWRGREVRLYGLGVLEDSRAEGATRTGDCSELSNRRPPDGVVGCRVLDEGGARLLRLTLSDGREVTFR